MILNTLRAIYNYLFSDFYEDSHEIIEIVPPGYCCAAYYTKSIEEQIDCPGDYIEIKLLRLGDRESEASLREIVPGAFMMIYDAGTIHEAREKAKIWLPSVGN